MDTTHIFIVEDDSWFSEFLEYHIKTVNDTATIQRFTNGKDLLKQLNKQPDIITLDYSLPDYDGRELLKAIKEQCPGTYVIIISGQNDLNLAVDLLKEGAHDYIVKDVDTKERIWKTIRNVQSLLELNQEVKQLREQLSTKKQQSSLIIGDSQPMRSLLPLIEKASNSSINVSIFGETGTGKELIAQSIHQQSEFRNEPFIAVNLGAIPRELAESELFGHEKGSFTGAIQQRIGKFEEAGKGTLFLDEIGEMDLSMQVKLLRVLQEREVVRVGGNKAHKIQCRIICATHKDLEQEVSKGNFRQDLFYRIIGLPIELPPLRNRGNDVLLLAEHFMRQIARDHKLRVKTLSETARERLLNYHYPGNVRELKAVIELAMVLADNDTIEKEHLRFHTTSIETVLDESTMTLHQITLFLIHTKLEKYHNDVQRVAEELDIGKSTIYRLLKEERERNPQQTAIYR